MLLLKKNYLNKITVTASENKTLNNPTYLFSFTHIFSKETISFIPKNISTNTSRYDEFEFYIGTPQSLTGNTPTLNFTQDGQYYYSIYEQYSTTNTDPSKALNKIEEGRALLINDNLVDLYNIYRSPNENNSNYVYYTDIENQSKLIWLFRPGINIFSGNQEWVNDGYPVIVPVLYNGQSDITDSFIDYNGIGTQHIIFKEYEVTITGGSQSITYNFDLANLTGTTNFSIPLIYNQIPTGYTFDNIVIYDDKNDLITNEPAFTPALSGISNNCGRFIAMDRTQDFSATSITDRFVLAEYGGTPWCNTSNITGLHDPFWIGGNQVSDSSAPFIYSAEGLYMQLQYGVETFYLLFENSNIIETESGNLIEYEH